MSFHNYNHDSCLFAQFWFTAYKTCSENQIRWKTVRDADSQKQIGTTGSIHGRGLSNVTSCIRVHAEWYGFI